jgi:hypothetical protein
VNWIHVGQIAGFFEHGNGRPGYMQFTTVLD